MIPAGPRWAPTLHEHEPQQNRSRCSRMHRSRLIRIALHACDHDWRGEEESCARASGFQYSSERRRAGRLPTGVKQLKRWDWIR
jgi:hypothetical protein